SPIYLQLPSFPTRRSSDLIWILILWLPGPAFNRTFKPAAKFRTPAGQSRRAFMQFLGRSRTQNGTADPALAGIAFDLSPAADTADRKSTRLNSSHSQISYA